MVTALMTVAWWFDQFPYIVRRTPHPKLGPTCEFRLCHAFTASRRRPTSTWLWRQAIFLLFLTLHKLFIMQHIFLIIIITIISGLHYFLCTRKWSGDFGVTRRPTLTMLCHHFGVSSSPLRHLGTGLGDGTLSRIKLGPRHQYRTH